MAPVTPTGEPSLLTAGDSWRWRIGDHTDYPNSEAWALKYEFVGDDVPLTITPTFQTSGDDINHWLVSEATTVTGLTAGSYKLVKRFVGSGTHAGREETIGSDGKLNGTPFVVSPKPDPRTAEAGDFQTAAAEELTLIKKIIKARLANDLPKEYDLAGRRFVKETLSDLYRIWSGLIAATETERSGQLGQTILVEFPLVGA